MNCVPRNKRISQLCSILTQTGLFLLFYTIPTSALTWDQFSRSMHKGFTERQPIDWNNMIGILITMVIFILLMGLFHLYNKWQQRYLRTWYLEFRRKMKTKESRLPDGRPEKRKWFRLRNRSVFRWIAPHSGDEQYHRDRMVDISGGGLSFTTAENLNVGTQMTFLLDIGDENRLPLNGYVVRVERGELGGDMRYFVAIQFDGVDENQRQRLVNWIIQGERDGIRRQKNDSTNHSG